MSNSRTEIVSIAVVLEFVIFVCCTCVFSENWRKDKKNYVQCYSERAVVQCVQCQSISDLIRPIGYLTDIGGQIQIMQPEEVYRQKKLVVSKTYQFRFH